MFEFENPSAFLLLLLIPILYIMRNLRLLSRISFDLNLSDWNGTNFIWNTKPRKILSGITRVLCIFFYINLVTALANPLHHTQQKIYSSRGATIFFVLDVSPSMAAKDIGDINRLESSKNAIRTLASVNDGADIGLIEMAQTASVIIPPTMDRKIFFQRLDSITAGELGDGTAIGNGISLAVYHLESISAAKKSIVLITDGENNAGSIHPYTAARLAGKKDISLYVVGIGTKGSVPLEYTDPKTGKFYSGYLESNFDTSSLSKTAAEGNGLFFEVESLQSLSQALSQINRNETVIQSYHVKKQAVCYYRHFIIAAIICIILAWIIRRIILLEVL
ncbi:MAG: VWA domain-containing protein [Treponema sp.]|nr:VWA domain-containing protein [Treponema sp.]